MFLVYLNEEVRGLSWKIYFYEELYLGKSFQVEWVADILDVPTLESSKHKIDTLTCYFFLADLLPLYPFFLVVNISAGCFATPHHFLEI